MIPASYLFKDIYRREWLDPELDCDIARRRAGRLPYPFSALGAFLRRLPAPQARPSNEWSGTPAQ